MNRFILYLQQRLCAAMLSTSLLLCGGPLLAATPVQRADPPPSAELKYDIVARQSGLRITGNAHVIWQRSKQSYKLTSRTHAMIIGQILETHSKGRIARDGLRPESFIEQHFRKGESQTLFDYAKRKITFTRSDNHYDIQQGEQDRSSIVWQLAALARADQAQFQAGQTLTFFVAGQRDADMWTFHVLGEETISTPLGDMTTVHLLRDAPPDDPSQKLDIWLAPSQDWYPARIRFAGDNNDYIEQTLAHIIRSSHSYRTP